VTNIIWQFRHLFVGTKYIHVSSKDRHDGISTYQNMQSVANTESLINSIIFFKNCDKIEAENNLPITLIEYTNKFLKMHRAILAKNQTIFDDIPQTTLTSVRI
jgi:hypothetical protein